MSKRPPQQFVHNWRRIRGLVSTGLPSKIAMAEELRRKLPKGSITTIDKNGVHTQHWDVLDAIIKHAKKAGRKNKNN